MRTSEESSVVADSASNAYSAESDRADGIKPDGPTTN